MQPSFSGPVFSEGRPAELRDRALSHAVAPCGDNDIVEVDLEGPKEGDDEPEAKKKGWLKKLIS